ncbi:MAG TPA: hypothetical protein PK737_02545 [Bacilli bacterium]|nr:hypothetical protein [Bacilli bacterium]
MPLITDNFQQKKLKTLEINIKTKYIVDDKVLERNTDGSLNNDITKGIRSEKQYYLKQKLIHTENLFDSRIEYTFIDQALTNKEYSCPNCGFTAKIKTFADGCPYCRTYYNIDYTDKDLGSKYHYDNVLHNNIYRFITLIIDLIISMLLSYLYIKYTGRTFNVYDGSKIIIYGLILATILYYFFYLFDAYIVLLPIKIYKNYQNEKQKLFWKNSNINQKKFFNNLNYELRKHFYQQQNIIDYDILDYTNLDTINGNIDQVKVTIQIRLIYLINNKIKAKITNRKYTFKKQNNELLVLKDDANLFKCHNCGAAINAIQGECAYCHTKINSLQEWILVNKNNSL